MRALEDKIDGLYLAIDSLSAGLGQCLQQGRSRVESEVTEAESRKSNPAMEHKDILDDSGEVSTASVSPEIQIRRLNTQLTAAYNRIAALEEQLLARHIHF